MSRFFPQPHGTLHSGVQRQRRRNWGLWLAIVFFLGFSLVWVAVRRSGFWLVQNDSVAHTSWLVVLDGQGPDMERTDFAANWALQGNADTVLVLGRRIFKDRYAADFYAQDIARQGVEPSRIFLLRHDDRSTMEEALSTIPRLRARGVDTAVLVTAPAASRRAAMLFNGLAQGSPVFLTVAIDDPDFSPRSWIHSREGRKSWLREWLAITYARLELLWLPAIETRLADAQLPLPNLAEESVIPSEPVLVPILSADSVAADSTDTLEEPQELSSSSAKAKSSSSTKVKSSSSTKAKSSNSSKSKSSSSGKGKSSSSKKK